MPAIQRFEDIEGWQKARVLTREIYQTSAQGELARDFGLKDQMRRAGVSCMSNIAEGFDREGNKEFVQFLSVAKGSTGEIKSHLYVALDAKLITPAEFDHLYRLATDTGRLIGGFMRYLRTSPLRGRKF